jgi:hypothetical protein
MSDTERFKNSSRWWEYYVVRYFIGTIVGAGAMLMFNEFAASPLKGKIFPAISSFQDAGVHHIVVLVALGFAYCYVASAPMLTIHAFRGQIRSGYFTWTSIWLVSSFLILFFGLNFYFSFKYWNWQILSLAFVSIVLAVQITFFAEAMRTKFKCVADYYWRLSKARASAAPQVQEYVESYRHLREHGNAFFIIIFELGFAMAAISAPDLFILCALLLLWVTPAAMVWGVATLLESRLAGERG